MRCTCGSGAHLADGHFIDEEFEALERVVKEMDGDVDAGAHLAAAGAVDGHQQPALAALLLHGEAAADLPQHLGPDEQPLKVDDGSVREGVRAEKCVGAQLRQRESVAAPRRPDGHVVVVLLGCEGGAPRQRRN
jgi:hypothetical protein